MCWDIPLKSNHISGHIKSDVGRLNLSFDGSHVDE